MLSDVYLRKYRYIGLGLIVVGLIGVKVPLPHSDSGNGAVPIFTTIIVVGALSLLFPLWVRYSARRRSDGLAVDGDYDITDNTVMMRSGTENGRLDWEDVTRVTETHRFWVLYVGKAPYTVIPREFMSVEQQQTLRDFLVERGSLPAAPV